MHPLRIRARFEPVAPSSGQQA